MKKVYCKNCKHWYEMTYNYSPICGDHCTYETFKKNEEVSRIIGQERGEHSKIEYKKANKSNDCPYYKRKWYLFWIN